MTASRTLVTFGTTSLLLSGTGVAALAAFTASPVSAVVDLTVTDLSDGPAVASDCTTPVAGACVARQSSSAPSSEMKLTISPG